MNLRFSLSSLICVTSFAALACAALARPGAGWLSLIVSGFVLVFFLQLLRALLMKDGARATAVGWLLFASGYLAITIGPWLNQNLGPHLASTRGLAYLQSRANPVRPSVDIVNWGMNDLSSYVSPASNSAGIWYSDSGEQWWHSEATSAAFHFHHTGHWLMALVAGSCGALLAGRLQDRSQQCAVATQSVNAASAG